MYETDGSNSRFSFVVPKLEVRAVSSSEDTFFHLNKLFNYKFKTVLLISLIFYYIAKVILTNDYCLFINDAVLLHWNFSIFFNQQYLQRLFCPWIVGLKLVYGFINKQQMYNSPNFQQNPYQLWRSSL